MGKNQSASNLTNIIKQDANGNITFVSGSTTLMSVSSSGAIATTGNVAGTASYASNAELFDGLDSTVFTLTSSFAAQTASFTAFTSSVNTFTSSLNSFSASILTFTASQNILNGTYATTGSNTFAGIQTVNSNLIVTGSITAQTLVVQTITSSVDFVTGSTRFGSLSSDTHVFTGSVNITGSTNLAGSLTVNKVAINSGNLNLASFPSLDLIISGGIGFSSGGSGAAALVDRDGSGNTTFYGGSGDIKFTDLTMTSNYLTIKNAGSVGIGVIPSAWYTGYTALQVGFSGAIWSNKTSADTNTTMIGNNAYLNSGATNWIYQNNGFATRYTQVSGEHQFYTAASGTASAAITWTQAMTLDASGRLGIGTTTIYSGAKLHILGGILAVEPTNGNTNSEILIGRGLSSLGTSAGSGITSKINFAFEGSNDNFYQEAGFVTTTANQTRINSAADFYISTKAAGASSPSEKFRITSTGVVALNATDATYISFAYLGTTKGFIGVAGASTDIISGAPTGDMTIRAQQSMRFSTGGDGERMRILNNFTLAGSSAGTGGPTQVIGTTAMVGILFVSIGTQSCAAIFIINAGSPPVLVSQTTTETRFSITNDNGNTANVYVSGTDIVLRNNIQATRAFYCQFFGKL